MKASICLRLSGVNSGNTHLPKAFGSHQWKHSFASGFRLSSVKTPICLRLLNAENEKQTFARGFLTPQRRATIFRRLSCDTKMDNPKRKVMSHRKSRRAKAEGRPSSKRFWSESLRLRITHKIADCLRRTTGRNTSVAAVCVSFSRQNHLVRPIVRVFRATDFPVERLCEFFGPQTSRWSDCASFSSHRLLGGAIVRVFRATDFPVGRLREVFTPQTFRWADCARFSSHRLPGGAIVRDNRSPRNLFVGAIFQFSSPASVKNSHLCHPEI